MHLLHNFLVLTTGLLLGTAYYQGREGMPRQSLTPGGTQQDMEGSRVYAAATFSNCSVLLLLCLASVHSFAVAFTAPRCQDMSCIKTPSPMPLGKQRLHDVASTQLYNLFEDEDEDLEKYDFKTAAQIRKARKLLEDAKKKLEATETVKIDGANGEANGSKNESKKQEATPLPFFASRSSIPSSKKIKSKTNSGIVADGATMTTLSNSEPWELRPLNQMFLNEPRSDYDGNVVNESSGGSKMAEKDLARQIMNMKRQLQGEDFKKVFDQRNRWIGEIE